LMEWLVSMASRLSPEEWQALAAVVTVFLALIAALVAFVQVRDARRLREEQAAPYVVVTLENADVGMGSLDLVVKNIGSTPAFDVSVSIDPPMERALDAPGYPFMGARPLREPIKLLAPGQEIRLWFDQTSERSGKDLPNLFEATVTGLNSRGKKLREARFPLDADFGDGGLYPKIHDLHWLGFRVEGIEKTLKKVATSLSKMELPSAPKEAVDPPLTALLQQSSAFRQQSEQVSLESKNGASIEDASNP